MYFTTDSVHINSCVYIPVVTEVHHTVLRAALLYYSTDPHYTPTMDDVLKAVRIGGNAERSVVALCQCDYDQAYTLVDIATA